MQKDVHFYLTYAVARKIGIQRDLAKRIAWANYFTDDLKQPRNGIQTQCGILGQWARKKIQREVLVPFHFIPGNRVLWPWATARDSAWARALTRDAIHSADPLRVGIALHAHQDTYSHQGFSGWREDANSCFPWYDLTSVLPNVGHAEMTTTPDRVEENWIDPRDQRKAMNKRRALGAARTTYHWLCKFHSGVPNISWTALQPEIWSVLKIVSYDDRKDAFRRLSGEPSIRYSTLTNQMIGADKDDFVVAAVAHRAVAQALWAGLQTP